MTLIEKLSLVLNPRKAQSNNPLVFYWYNRNTAEEVTRAGCEMLRKLEKEFETDNLQRKE